MSDNAKHHRDGHLRLATQGSRSATPQHEGLPGPTDQHLSFSLLLAWGSFVLFSWWAFDQQVRRTVILVLATVVGMFNGLQRRAVMMSPTRLAPASRGTLTMKQALLVGDLRGQRRGDRRRRRHRDHPRGIVDLSVSVDPRDFMNIMLSAPSAAAPLAAVWQPYGVPGVDTPSIIGGIVGVAIAPDGERQGGAALGWSSGLNRPDRVSCAVAGVGRFASYLLYVIKRHILLHNEQAERFANRN